MRNSLDLSEFFKNEAGKESIDRLLLFLSFPFATGLTIKIGTVEALGVYLTAYGAVAINNKWAGRNAVANDSEEPLVGNPDSDSAVDDKPLARKSKPARRGKTRAF
jgi:hypothetical protein